MTSPTFRKAERRKARLRLGLVGPAGSGKTYSALMVAKGLGGKTALIDTEAGSGDLYASDFDYDILQISSPFTPDKYLDAIRAAEAGGYDNIILDSISHLWSGEGGLLDMQGKMADKEKNSYTAWRHITPLHNQFIDTMLQSSCHVIATMRAKTEYILEENEKGKKVPKKVGMAPVQRDGMDYEFTVVFDIDHDHDAKASKDRTKMYPVTRYFKVSDATGKELLSWLNEGKDTVYCEHCLKAGLKVMVSDEEAEASKAATGGKVYCPTSLAAWKKAQDRPQGGPGAAVAPETAPAPIPAPEAPPAPAQGLTAAPAAAKEHPLEVMTEYRNQFAAAKTVEEVKFILGTANLDKRVIESKMLESAVAGLAKDRESELASAALAQDPGPCKQCDATGKVHDGNDCPACHGLGVI